MRILIISHTEHYIDTDGNVVGWEPTVKELDYLATSFGEVIHIACLNDKKNAPPSAIAYQNQNVRFVAIPTFGGKGILNKLKIITSAWSNIKKVSKELEDADIFQFRAPTSIGLYIIPYLTWFSRKKGWYKYAGNWVQKRPPISYRVQRWMLLQQSRKVTINGSWNSQSSKCISFENPCLNDEDRVQGLKHTHDKVFDKPYRICFVGELNESKGIYRVFDALKKHHDLSLFSGLDIVGDGKEMQEVKQLAASLAMPVKVHGALKRTDVFEIYKQSDFILLPSESEGFPKVVAEAANFGCIPIVSDVSSIGQYVNGNNGFLWDSSFQSFSDFFTSINFRETNSLMPKSKAAYMMAGAFTYDKYIEKLKQYIF